MKNHTRNLLIALLVLIFILSITRFAKAAGPTINLPPGTVNATYNNPGSKSYWDITLSSVPSGYDVTNGLYVGWCCDETFTINNGATLGVNLYSSYDPLQPWKGGNTVWNKVNYIINHKQGTADDVQAAIWNYIDNKGGTIDTYVTNMITAADLNGGSFVPAHGQLLAVVVYLANSQATFIEVTVPVQLTVTSAYDTPTPTSGSYAPGSSITESVTPVVAGPTGTQYVCTGWTGTGNVPTSGTGTTTTFTITQDSSITWLWKTQYYLTVTSPYDTPTGQGWYDPGSTVTSSVTSPVGNEFVSGWTGTGSAPATGLVKTVTFTITQASSITWNWGYSAILGPSVGGQWAPITMQVLPPASTLGLLAPWIALALIAAATALATYRRLLKKHL